MPSESLYDQPLIKELMRFQHGARLWPTGSCPETVEEWKTWREHSRYESQKDAEKHRKEQSVAGQILDALSADQRNVLTCIEKVAGRTQNMAVLGLYDMLSEYCHPNADNRRLGFMSNILQNDEALVSFAGGLCPTPGAKRAAWLGMIAMIEAIDVYIQAHNAIHESMHALFDEIDLRG